MKGIVSLSLILIPMAVYGGAHATPRFPGEHWPQAAPEEVGLDPALLQQAADYLGGRGCIVRHGKMVFQWGDATRRGDVASAAKPWYTTFLWLAVEEGLLPSVDTRVADYVPALKALNPDLQHKDRDITFRHMGNQVSCYGVAEHPGTAYDYNDWQMALFVDTLFHKVYGATWENLDRDVLDARLANIIQCEDNPTLLAFGTGDRPGRLAVSPRDFARLGWLYLNDGRWGDTQVLPAEIARKAVSSPLPNSIPRTEAVQAEMLEGQRTMGSGALPDNQTDHHGGYSWAWWLNGVDREGNRFWKDAPLDVFTALGHKNGQRGMAAIPSLDMVIAWNDTTLGNRPGEPHPLNEVFRLLMAATEDGPMTGQVIVDPKNPAWLARHEDDGPKPFFMCGPGDPEGFLYRGARQPDGTRDGDQMAIIEKMRGSGANCIYLQAVRSHGGDGDGTHNPFVDSDPKKGLDEDILQQWETWFRAMDDAGIVIYFFIYDDSASIWSTGDAVGNEERAFVEGLVNHFEHHRNLMWCIAEEYQERFSPTRIKAITQVVRDADEHNHVIAVHKLDGLDFSEFADDPNIDQFAIQYNRHTASELHEGMLSAWRDARGRYNLNLSEAEDHGFGREARRKNWAAALAGAHSMPIGWLFSDDATPSRADLEACGHLVRVLESVNLTKMAPHDELAAGAAAYLLAEPGTTYVGYLPDARQPAGIRDVPAGDYALTWCNPVTGAWVDGGVMPLSQGEATFEAPDSMREDAAFRLCRAEDTAQDTTDLGHRDVTMWSPYLEWTLDNPTFEGNPFDVAARVTFTHAPSNTSRSTEMFYAGDHAWKFRFTGTRVGEWAFTTRSDDPELDGHAGTITVKPNGDPKIKGFLTHVGNQFAIMGEDEEDLRGCLFNVYMNNHIYHDDVRRLADLSLVDTMLDDTEANGFEISFAFICNNWFKLGALRSDKHDSVNPDLATFDILDRMIVRAHQRGMRWHLWAWGDEARRWTPIGVPGGINGPADRRLQRYIAARLGPLPGWTMGYGFDLIEWTTPEGRNGWASYLHEKMGWDHMLCTRGFKLDGAHNNIVSYSGFGGQDLSTTRGGPANFAEVAEDIDANPDSPSFYEERHSYQRDGFKLDMDGTRRLRWWQAMAGGLGGFYGFYDRSPHPYPNPEQLRTAQRFWDGRFRLGLERAPGLSDGHCLKDQDNTFYVFYREGVDTIRANLEDAAGDMHAVAVDTTKPYAELDLGTMGPGIHTFAFPHVSDWAVAVARVAPVKVGGGAEPDMVVPTADVSGFTNALQFAADTESTAPNAGRHPLVQNGWLTQDDHMIWGWIQHNGWWRPGQRPNLTRRSVGDPQGDVRPNRTEDLDKLTDNMLRHAYPGFEHNYGLWYDRRRDAHDTAHRPDGNVVPPFLEQPWGRSQEGRAADGLPKYDLTQFNPWYFDRLAEFARLCDQKGTVLLHKYHMQHNLLETPAHYVDFPWRPFNCIQDTGLPDSLPAANAFYDMSNPVRRDLQRRYIRHCLDVLGDYRNVIHLTAEEYTGPLPFVQFWMDTIAEWEQEHGKKVCIGLGAPKDVQDAILNDPVRGPRVDVIDMRYWWYRADGSLNAISGGQQVPGRGIESGSNQGKETSLAQIYRKTREYRDRYPDKALIDAINAGREAYWAFFMGGGSLLVRGQIEYEGQKDPAEYEQPAGVGLIIPSYSFINTNLAEKLLRMRPADIVSPGGAMAWCLADPGTTYLVYAPEGGAFTLQLGEAPGSYRARWFNPTNGQVSNAKDGYAEGGGEQKFTCPGEGDWALLLERS